MSDTRNLFPRVGGHSVIREREWQDGALHNGYLQSIYGKEGTSAWGETHLLLEHGYSWDCNRARRLFQKARGRADFVKLRKRYRSCRTNLSQELKSVCREMKINKAPEIDGIPNITLKVAIDSNAELFRQVFDACIQERMFPRIWKRQRLVLIPSTLYGWCGRKTFGKNNL